MANLNKTSGKVILNGVSASDDDNCYVRVNGKKVKDEHRHHVRLVKTGNAERYVETRTSDYNSGMTALKDAFRSKRPSAEPDEKQAGLWRMLKPDRKKEQPVKDSAKPSSNKEEASSSWIIAFIILTIASILWKAFS